MYSTSSRLNRIIFLALLAVIQLVVPLHGQATLGIFPPQGNRGPWNNDVDIIRIDAAGNQTNLGAFTGAGVSTVTRMADGRLIAAFQYFSTSDPQRFDRIATSISSDEGKTWSDPFTVQLDGYEVDLMRPFDPTLVALPDGRLRMYFTSNRSPDFRASVPQIYSAISDDGLRYTFEPGVRFGLEGRIVIDCAVAIHQGVFHMIVPNNGSVEEMRQSQQGAGNAGASKGYHAVSKDGLAFTRVDDLNLGPQDRWLGNMQSDGSELRFFGTGPSSWPISSSDGIQWSRTEPTLRLPGADPAAVRLRDGSWLVLLTSPPRRNVSPPLSPWGDDLSTPPIRVTKCDSAYSVAPKLSSGAFETNQAADIALGSEGLNKSGGPVRFNHPSGLASDGRCLLVSDRWNNRILIWKSAPSHNVPPDLVLGQTDFLQNNSGRELTQLNWPGNVTISPDGKRVVVADTNNDRVLIWTSFPRRNGQAADLEIDLKQLPHGSISQPAPGDGNLSRIRTRLGWPWGVWTDGNRLAVVATHGNAVLVWDEFPDRNHQPPDYKWYPTGAGTPRNITSDGRSFFALSDHNYGRSNRPATLVWDHFPNSTDSDPNYVWGEWMKGTYAENGTLFMASMQRIYGWKGFPASEKVDANVVLSPNEYRNGDGPDAVVVGNRLYVCNYNGNNVLGWNGLPTLDHQPPDFSVGSEKPSEDTWSERFFIKNPTLASDGTSLFASSDFDRKLFVWNKLPDQSNAKPNWIYELPEGPWDIAADSSRLAAAGKRTVYLWDRIPRNGELPTRVLVGSIGSVQFQDLTGVAIDDRYFYLADRTANRIYVWSKTPDHGAEPDIILETPNPGRLSSDGKYLIVCPFEGQELCAWPIDDLRSDTRPYRLSGRGILNLPGHAIATEGRLFVADRNNHRVQVWNKIEDAFAGIPADAYLGAADANDRTAGLSAKKLFMPSSLVMAGGYLWVGEFKFSSRILRYTPNRER
jgi:hypothetical protein